MLHAMQHAPELRSEVAAPAAAPAAGSAFHELVAGLLAGPASTAAQLASPALGSAWARALITHWSRLERQGGLDPQQPIYLLDLTPAAGHLAAVLLPPLVAELQAHGLQGWRWAYLACAGTREQQAALTEAFADEPLLRPHLESGLLSAAHWPARTGQPLVHGHQRLPLFGTRNPVVALALGGWSSQPSRLFAVHRGRLLQGRVRTQAQASGAVALSYAWAEIEMSEAGSTTEAVLLQRYCAGLPSAALLLSEQALAQLDAVADFSGGRYLLLCADAGVVSERQIRDQALAPPEAVVPGELRLPVNFHALGWHQRMNGARVAQRQCRDDGWVLHLACRDDSWGVDEQAWRHLSQELLRVHPDDRERGGLPPGPVADASALEYELRRTAGDPKVLRELAAALQDVDLEGDPASARGLLGSLEHAWHQVIGRRDDTPLALAVAALATRLDGWGLARSALAQCAPVGSAQEAACCRMRAVVERSTGHAGDALQWAQRAVQADASDPLAQSLLAALRERATQWLANPWVAQDHMREGSISLEPLDESHQAALRYQLRDPQIAQMAQMPGPDEVPTDDSVDYALMHTDHGLVGVIGFRHHQDMAHFHLWIGADHQGQGLGACAVRLLLGVLHASGIPHLFTGVFQGNLRCRRVLERTGFTELPLVQASAAGDVVYAYRPSAPEAERPLALPELQARLAELHHVLEQ